MSHLAWIWIPSGIVFGLLSLTVRHLIIQHRRGGSGLPMFSGSTLSERAEEMTVPYKDAAYIETLEKAIIAIAEDGWLYHGPEGMSEEQKTLYAAYRLVTGMDVKENGLTAKPGADHD